MTVDDAGIFEEELVNDPALEDVRGLVIGHHYSKRMPSGVMYTFGVRRSGVLCAAIIFSMPATRWHEPVLELSRLVRDDSCSMPLTKLISHAVKGIRRDGRYDLLISFADHTHQHHGGVYQASSWNFDQTNKPKVDGFVVDGEFIPARTCSAVYGTSSQTGLPALLPGHIVEAHWDAGKSLYWKALSSKGAAKASRLNLKQNLYPKPKERPLDYKWQRYRTSAKNPERER